jgi:hypothetical protein
MTTNHSTVDGSAEVTPLQAALRQSTAALKADGVPFALAGGYALWVHGAPEPEHDVDVVVTEADVPAAVKSLDSAGLRIVRPPEDWLFKAYLDDAMVDVLHRLNGHPVSPELIESADDFEVLGVRIPVLPATDIMITKLLALSEHYCDFAALLPVVRAVREQLDWSRIQAATEQNPFAAAFLFLLERLAIAEPDSHSRP